MDHHVHQLYFSPSGTTQAVVGRVSATFPGEREVHDLLRHPEDRGALGPGDLMIAGMPVFAGRIPALCVDRLRRFTGRGTPAVALAVYGNRDYEDALLELRDLLEAGGFRVIAGAAVVARHSIFRAVAAGRPDAADLALLDAFAADCAGKLEGLTPESGVKLEVKGNYPYKAAKPVPLIPTGDDNCNGCGVCAALCPVGAIDGADPKRTDREKCISCTACIANCPRGARGFRGPVYATARLGFEAKCAKRREPEFFL